jgi:hypothetical protein
MIALIAIAQLLPFALFPWTLSVQSLAFLGVLVLLSAFLGWALIKRKAWGRKMIIFTQGFNIIVRIITFFGNVYDLDSGINLGLLITYVLSVALSWFILLYIDRPEMQLVFES